MDDRELLELAAKAAGIGVSTFMHAVDGVYTHDAERWSPLTDDGDCARMEAELKINITFTDHDVTVQVCDFAPVSEWLSDNNNDRQAARRHASTRIAAEIGRTM